MTNADYLTFLKDHSAPLLNNSEYARFLQEHKKEFWSITTLNLDPAQDLLESLYCPVKRARRRDPLCLLRSLLLMTIMKIASSTKWVQTMRGTAVIALFCGFFPEDTPGIGTYYDFMKRIINGPYKKLCEHRVRRSALNEGLHKRNLQKEKGARKDPFDPYHSQSEKLAELLFSHAEEPRADDFQKILEDVLVQLGIKPSIDEGVITEVENLIVSGDGSIMAAASSSQGKASCSCRAEGISPCTHDRLYTSPTAQWCYSSYRDCYIFGDRYYHLTLHQNGHDFPLISSMPGGNESDYTLSLKAIDRFLKVCSENALPMSIKTFCGDGHHDSYAHYDYFEKKEIIPIIPLSETRHVIPHLSDTAVQLDEKGTPVCPAGLLMRHHMYNKEKRTHVFCCPVKRHSHRNGTSLYVNHLEECPLHKDCAPESSLGPLVYIKSATDPRMYPPIPRESKKFKELMKQRTSTERCNFLNDTYHLDRSCRNADYGLIRLTLVNIAEHAVIRYLETVKKSSPELILAQMTASFSSAPQTAFFDTS
jgi:hypothetical protein